MTKTVKELRELAREIERLNKQARKELRRRQFLFAITPESIIGNKNIYGEER